MEADLISVLLSSYNYFSATTNKLGVTTKLVHISVCTAQVALATKIIQAHIDGGMIQPNILFTAINIKKSDNQTNNHFCILSDTQTNHHFCISSDNQNNYHLSNGYYPRIDNPPFFTLTVEVGV